MPSSSDTVRSLFADGLRNAHALENQALSIMKPQLSRIESYPELAEQLRRHVDETDRQIARIDAVLDRMGESSSSLKDTAMSFTGGMAALSHSMAGDEILKNTFANHAFENFEIAAYTSLISLASACGMEDAARSLTESLEEEKRMAAWILENTPRITLKYAELSEAGAYAKV